MCDVSRNGTFAAIESNFEAGRDASRWPDVVGAMPDLLGATGAHLFHYDQAASHGRSSSLLVVLIRDPASARELCPDLLRTSLGLPPRRGALRGGTGRRRDGEGDNRRGERVEVHGPLDVEAAAS